MNHYPSRSEKRYARFYQIAENGGLHSLEILYSSEARKLSEKSGFSNKILGLHGNFPNLYDVDVSWSNAFGDVIPYPVEQYINGTISTFPNLYVNNLAEELYVIAHRAKFQK